MDSIINFNPTDKVNVSFSDYVTRRKSTTQNHMQGGVPDYAFHLDYELRKKIDAMPIFYKVAKAVTSTYVPEKMQFLNMNALKVGPNQFPDIYEMVTDCARRLNIGIPHCFVINATEMNAYAVATEDDTPVIVLHSGIVERMTRDELKAVIGHECGHVHNNHGIYNTVAELLINQTLGAGILGGLTAIALKPLEYAMNSWSRAAEVTCDRAGIICSDDINATISTQGKLAFGAAFGRNEVNTDEILKQIKSFEGSAVRLNEVLYDHPIAARRILAAEEFINSDVLYSWRPEWKTPDLKTIDRAELEKRCRKHIVVVKKEKR